MTCESDKSVDLRDYPNDPETKESVIESRREALRELGFSDDFIGKLKKKHKTLYKKESIQNKIEGLKERGFKDPIKLTTTFPSTISLALDNIDRKIEGLKERGFKDPVKLITTFPSTIGSTFENIDRKIEGLKERGFKDPVKLITTFPSTISLALDNIDKKLNVLKKLVAHYNLDLDPIGIIEGFPVFLGLKIDKIWTTARIISEKIKTTDEVTNTKIKHLLFNNLENLILATRTETSVNLDSLMSESKRIKKQELSKAEKRSRIATLPDNDRLKKRYFRGYPMKDN